MSTNDHHSSDGLQDFLDALYKDHTLKEPVSKDESLQDFLDALYDNDANTAKEKQTHAVELIAKTIQHKNSPIADEMAEHPEVVEKVKSANKVEDVFQMLFEEDDLNKDDPLSDYLDALHDHKPKK